MKSNNSLEGKKISIIGAGVSGRSLAKLARHLGADVFVSDSAKLKPEVEAELKSLSVEWESEGNTERLINADEVLLSSGISPSLPLLDKARDRGVKITCELDFVYPYLDGKVISVTGSNGKTTTTSMTGFFLEQLGYKCHTGGNIGNAVAKAANERFDFIVLELSSFQLAIAETFTSDTALVTNLAPDHIDWHGSYENYVAAKANIIRRLAAGGTAIYQKRDEKALSAKTDRGLPLSWDLPEVKDRGIFMDEYGGAAYLVKEGERSKLFDFKDLPLLGKHNMENCAMSLATLDVYDISVPGELLGEYKAPGHRCALVGKVNGITFVDDSKGTNVAASVTAMSSLPEKKIVILGGKGKGEQYAPLAEAVKRYAIWAVILGSEKDKIAAALDVSGFTRYTKVTDMEAAVREAYAKASAGQTVLLSPACTSWDMYPNYGARGDHFAAVAKEIIEKGV
jgi:UDP-N-acetylmuramoylalanine--D-glutamate ligase